MNTIGVSLGSFCNAKCSHCCFSCSPQLKTSIEKDKIRSIVHMICESEKIKLVGFTGGEIFLQYEFLKELIKICHEANKMISLTTNGFWGRQKETTYKYFLELQNLGVTSITLSHDEFHSEYIKTSSIKNILEIQRNFPKIKVKLNMVISKSKKSNKILEELDESLMNIEISKFPMQKVGKAELLSDKEIILMHDIKEKKLLYCPGISPIFNF